MCEDVACVWGGGEGGGDVGVDKECRRSMHAGNNLVFLGQSQQGRAVDDIAEFGFGETVWKVRFGGLDEGVVRDKTTGARVVSVGREERI